MHYPLTLAFGEVLWDLLPDQTLLGGAPFNFAYRLHSLGMPAIPVSRVGSDLLGERALAAVRDLGLDTSQVQIDPAHPTGTVQVTLDAANQPDYVIVPGVAYDFIDWTAELQALAPAAGCICFGTLIQRAPASRGTLAALLDAAPRALKLLDINLRKLCHTPETVRFSLRQADILKLNEHEIVELARLLGMPVLPLPEAAAALQRDWKLQYVLVTLGEFGVFAIGPDGRSLYSPGYRVALVDPLGSGDAFTAAFVEAILRGAELGEACENGNLLGALVASRAGGTAPISREEIEALRASTAPRRIATQ